MKNSCAYKQAFTISLHEISDVDVIKQLVVDIIEQKFTLTVIKSTLLQNQLYKINSFIRSIPLLKILKFKFKDYFSVEAYIRL